MPTWIRHKKTYVGELDAPHKHRKTLQDVKMEMNNNKKRKIAIHVYEIVIQCLSLYGPECWQCKSKIAKEFSQQKPVVYREILGIGRLQKI